MKVTFIKGISGSGKSTLARRMSGLFEINRDEIRKMLFNIDNLTQYKITRTSEKQVTEEEFQQVRYCVEHKLDCVISNTNLKSSYIDQLKNKFLEYTSDVEFKTIDMFDVYCTENSIDKNYFSVVKWVNWCKKNNRKRIDIVPDDVIDKQAEHYFEQYKEIKQSNSSLPKAIIVDIDGTLAHRNSRNPFDESLVGNDDVDTVIAEMVNIYYQLGYYVYIVSGRHVTCSTETKLWLEKYNINYNTLLMRNANDNRGDDIVKYEIYKNSIEQNHDIRFVLDDRDRVVKMWRCLLGLKVLQVEYGNF